MIAEIQNSNLYFRSARTTRPKLRSCWRADEAQENEPTEVRQLADKDTTVQGVVVHFQKDGHGKPVLLLHGWGGNHNSWFPIYERLKKMFEVFALDLPGFGQSGSPDLNWQLDDYAGFLKMFIRQEIGENVSLIGHSFGGQAAIRLASLYPQMVSKLVLTDSAGIRNLGNPKKMGIMQLAKIGKSLFSLPGLNKFQEKARQKLYRIIGEHDYEEAGVLKEIFKNIINEDIRRDLPQIFIPALIIWGGKDKTTPLKDGRLMQKLLPDSQLVVFENGSHFAYLEEPERFTRQVVDFLK